MRHASRRQLIAVALLLCFAGVATAQTAVPPAQAPAKAEKEVKKLQDATEVFTEVMSIPDKAIPEAVLERAVGIAVFPGVIKAAMGFGAEWGYGVLSAKDTANGGWTRPAFLKLKSGSWGAQIGGQSTDLVLVVMNRKGLDSLMRSEFKIAGEAQASAGPVGRGAQAATDVLMRAQILSYSRSRGLFAGISLSGAAIYEDTDANERFYGQPLRTEDLVGANLTKPIEAPAIVAEWRGTLARLVDGAVATSGRKKK